MNENENEIEEDTCDCCRAPGVPLKDYAIDDDDDDSAKLCNLCAFTSVGGWHPRGCHDADIVEVLKTICFVGNEILKAISKLTPPNEAEKKGE